MEVLRTAFAENRILITNDKDFGEKAYRERLPHKGVILLRGVPPDALPRQDLDCEHGG